MRFRILFLTISLIPLLFPPAQPAGADSCQTQEALVTNYAAEVQAADLHATAIVMEFDRGQECVARGLIELNWINSFVRSDKYRSIEESGSYHPEVERSATLAEITRCDAQMREAAQRGRIAIFILNVWKAALAAAKEDYNNCRNPPMVIVAKPVCEVNRPLLKDGDNAAATMTVTSNHVCTCGFERSDGSLEVAAAPKNGTATASDNRCTYQSRDGFTGSDSFTLIRQWPEGGSASVTFTVTVVAVQPLTVER